MKFLKRNIEVKLKNLLFQLKKKNKTKWFLQVFPKSFNFLQIRVTFLPRVTGVYSSTQLKREGVLQLGFIIKGSEFLNKLWCCVSGRVQQDNLVLSTELFRLLTTFAVVLREKKSLEYQFHHNPSKLYIRRNAVYNETTDGSSIESIRYRISQHEQNGCTVLFTRHQSTIVCSTNKTAAQSCSQGTNQQKCDRLF